MDESQIQESELLPLTQERISQIKNFLKPKGLKHDELSTEPTTTNGLYQIIYNFISKNYPAFPNTLNNNPNNQLQTFITAMNNIQQISFQRLNLSEQTEITQTQSYISNFSGFGQGNDDVNNILFTYKEHFGNISIWNVADSQGVETVRKEPFGPQIDTLNYLLPELNILFLDNRITLLIPCHDKFMKQNYEFLSSPASSLQDFMLTSHIGGPWEDENPEPTGAPPPPPPPPTEQADLVAARENNNRLIQAAMDRITQLQTEIRNMRSQSLPLGPPAVARGNRERRIRMRRDQIARNRAIIDRYEELNRQIDGSLEILRSQNRRRPRADAQPQADARRQAEEQAVRENNNRLILSARDRIALYNGVPFQEFDHNFARNRELATIYIPEPDTNNSIRGQIINEESIIRDGEELNRLLDLPIQYNWTRRGITQLRLQLDAMEQARTIVEDEFRAAREAEQAAPQDATSTTTPISEADWNLDFEAEFAALEEEEEEEAAAAEAEAEAAAAELSSIENVYDY